MAKSKINYQQLAVANWLFGETKYVRFLTKMVVGMTTHDHEFHDIVEKDENGKLINNVVSRYASNFDKVDKVAHDRSVIALIDEVGGSLKLDLQSLLNAGYLVHHTSFHASEARKVFAERFTSSPFSHTDALIRGTREGREWFEREGRALYQEAHDKRTAKRKAAERTVLIWAQFDMTPAISPELAAKIPEGVLLPLPKKRIMRPFATATVKGQTEKRISVTDVKLLEKFNQYGSTSTYRIADWPIHGSQPNLYVDPSSVMVDYADPAIVATLREIDVDDIGSFDRTSNYHMEQLLPLLIQMNNHLKQSGAAREDMMNEAINTFKNGNERKPR